MGLAKSGETLPLVSAIETCMALSACMDWNTNEPSAVTVLKRGDWPGEETVQLTDPLGSSAAGRSFSLACGEGMHAGGDEPLQGVK